MDVELEKGTPVTCRAVQNIGPYGAKRAARTASRGGAVTPAGWIAAAVRARFTLNDIVTGRSPPTSQRARNTT
jgi:hypothetical protein